MADSFETMMADIAQDYGAALLAPVRDATGCRRWRDVVYAQINGFRPLTLYVSVPEVDRPPPLVVFVHGGAWMLGHPMVTNPVYAGLDIEGNLLRAGYAVAKIAYRFSAEARFPAQLHDCKAAVRFLRKRAGTFAFDAGRIAAMGDSAGGHLVALMGLTAGRADMEGDVGELQGSSAVQAVVDWFGPTELLTMGQQAIAGGMRMQDDPNSPESMLVGGPIQSVPEAARAASPVTYVTAAAPPFLIQHGTHDRLVPLAQSRTLHKALLAAGVSSTLKVIEGADHCFWGAPGEGIVERDIEFLQAKLGN